jgi:ribose transport system ATP-binding protein
MQADNNPLSARTTGSPLLCMRGISKRFPGVVALESVNLEVGRGEVVALCGENGAGKSTLIKILGGVFQPDGGEVLLDNQAVVIRHVHDAMRLGIALIHQELNVLDNLDVAANVFLGREPCHRLFGLIRQKQLHTDAAPLLQRLGLSISTRTRLDRLSLAQQQMVEIAKALSQHARLIVMDEPTSSLTLTETDRLLTLISELRNQGVSVIYISHRLAEVGRVADRVEVLRDGRNVGQLNGQEINHDRIVRLMVGRDIHSFYAESHVTKTPGFLQIRNARSSRYLAQAVSFDAAQGEILGFAGLVGAGRSEIAKAIVGLDPSGGAEISLAGQPVDIRRPRDAISQGIYLVPEDRRNAGLVTEMNVRENISLPSLRKYTTLCLISQKRERKTAEKQISSLHIKTPSAETKVMNLSGGTQQKVVLGKWLAMTPRVMIFDEPTRGIDVGSKAEIHQLMRKLAEHGAVVLMISSDMEEILHVSDRVAVMHEGRIAGVLERPDCSEENIMNLAVGGRVSGGQGV